MNIAHVSLISYMYVTTLQRRIRCVIIVGWMYECEVYVENAFRYRGYNEWDYRIFQTFYYRNEASTNVTASNVIDIRMHAVLTANVGSSLSHRRAFFRDVNEWTSK